MFPWAVEERASKLLASAARRDLFGRLQGKALDARRLARHLGCPEGQASEFLDQLTELGFLRKKAGRYSNTVFAQRYLVRGSSRYLGDAFSED